MSETAIIAIAVLVGIGVVVALIVGRDFWFRGGGVSAGTKGPATKAVMSVSGKGSWIKRARQTFQPGATGDYTMRARRGGTLEDAVQEGSDTTAGSPKDGT